MLFGYFAGNRESSRQVPKGSLDLFARRQSAPLPANSRVAQPQDSKHAQRLPSERRLRRPQVPERHRLAAPVRLEAPAPGVHRGDPRAVLVSHRLESRHLRPADFGLREVRVPPQLAAPLLLLR